MTFPPPSDLPATSARVAIVHERFTELGGSERVVEQLHAMWPSATVHTTVVDRSVLPPGLVDADIRTGALQSLYRGGRGYAHLLPLMPFAIGRVDVGDVDLVLTSHHAFANRVHVPQGCRMVSYTHTPARWLWDPAFRKFEGGGAPARVLLGAFAATQRRADRAAAQRPDVVVANSTFVADRVERWWGRKAEVVHPPVDVDRFRIDPTVAREDFFLLAGRLVPYKRPEVAVEAANRAGVRLVVAGEGRSRAGLEAIAGATVEFLGAVDDATLVELYQRCTALIFPGVEDFGMIPVEAQACGAPVLAPRAGGIQDSVVNGKTGVLYDPEPREQVKVLANELSDFTGDRFDPVIIRKNAERFSRAAFHSSFRRVVETVCS